MSIYEAAVDTLLLCYCADEVNTSAADGIIGEAVTKFNEIDDEDEKKKKERKKKGEDLLNRIKSGGKEENEQQQRLQPSSTTTPEEVNHEVSPQQTKNTTEAIGQDDFQVVVEQNMESKIPVQESGRF